MDQQENPYTNPAPAPDLDDPLRGSAHDAAQQLHHLAAALRHAGDSLRDDEHPTVAELADLAAGNVDELSQALQERDFSELLAATEDFARRRPGLFVGGAVLAGFTLVRFLKSSRPSTADEPVSPPVSGPTAGRGLRES